MNVLLSIKPKYANQIINGNKKYEFRKSLFKNRDLDMVYIYSSSPVKRIVGAFSIKKIIEKHPEQLWSECKDFSGIDEDDFFCYFRGKEKGFAIVILFHLNLSVILINTGRVWCEWILIFWRI